ncbi:MAG TPA: HAMP domain-containing sensor histidine kinase [Beijerinckiaceae bacterium]|nr:HAMP domain-containing sensor histidine kinase [Beijerinckiaceae bacterium]
MKLAPAKLRLSVRWQLIGLWLLLAVSASITAYLFAQFYSQTTARQVSEAKEVADRACRTIGDRYLYFTTGWAPNASGINDKEFRDGLTSVVSVALAHISGVEGGIWYGPSGSLAYAYPTYEGSGPKTDLPSAELSAIAEINRRALSADGPAQTSFRGQAQTIILHACPLSGPIPQLTAWTMSRVYNWSGPAYNRLFAGMGLLAATVLGAALWLAAVIISSARRATHIASILSQHHTIDLPQLKETGDPDMDRLVVALNQAGQRLGEARQHAESVERLAAVGRLSASLAHEVRNPLAAMRLKAENALASPDPMRANAALQAVLQQVTRLDKLLSDLLATTHQKPIIHEKIDPAALMDDILDTHRDAAIRKGVHLTAMTVSGVLPLSGDREQLRRALDNLLVNALSAVGSDGKIELSVRSDGRTAVFSVKDNGPGVDPAIVTRLFEPFVTGRNDGTGLGLAIVREIARAHGGEARLVASSQGCNFEIEVPCHAS